MSQGQPVDVALGVNLPINLSQMGSGALGMNPIVDFILCLVGIFVFLAVVGVPLTAAFGFKLFNGLIPAGRTLRTDLDVSSLVETLTGSKVVEDFLSEPLDEFLERILGDKQSRSVRTVGDVLMDTGEALSPALEVLDYDNAFAAVQVPGEDCRQKVMCLVHTKVTELPEFMQRAYNFVGPLMQHRTYYSQAIIRGLSGQDCEEVYSDCPYNVFQMLSFIPLLKTNTHSFDHQTDNVAQIVPNNEL